LNFESQLAENVFRSKYLLEYEIDPSQAVERIIKAITNVFPEIEEEAREYINKQWFIPAGGVWRAAGNPSKNVSYINCTTLGKVDDNLEDIFDSLYKWAKFAAYGQGEGIDISLLRPRGAKVHNSSRSSTGAVSFMSLYDAVLKVIAQQGRRGASLISIIDHHPDIEEFVTIKDKPESDKSRIDTANISIQATNDFMEAILKDEDWILFYENKFERIEKKIKARELFDKICKMAWKCGDPGLQFIDTWKKYSNSDQLGYPLEASNACGEIPNSKYNVCDLSHINLAKFKEYGFEGFKKLIRFGVKFLNAVLINEYNENRSPIKEQAKVIRDNPRIGLGLTGLADYLLDNKVIYGSEKSIELVHLIFSTVAQQCYKEGYELGKKLGSFSSYNKEKIKQSAFIQRLLNEGLIEDYELDYQINVAYFSIAPTGSASLIANVGGSGIEPLFSKYMVRRERSTTKEWKEWFTFNPYVQRYLSENGIEVTKENADKLTEPHWVMLFDIKALDKIKLVAEAQKYVDNAISVTFNLPEEATIEDIEKVYIEAWKNELKGITVYREGSLTGVLITEQNYNKQTKEKESQIIHKNSGDYIERPSTLPCDIYETSHKGHKFLVLVGLLNDKPYEIFVASNEKDMLSGNKYTKGFIEKIKSGYYTLKIENGVSKIVIGNIGKQFSSLYSSLSRLVSISLRYNIPIPKILEQLNKESTFADFEKVITKVLKKYVPDETTVGKVCPECGSNLIFIGGCITCSNENCGYSKCE